MEFYSNSSNVTEGYLGDKKCAEILFVLKEPNTQNAKDFWLKRALEGKENATRYINVLGVLAGKLLGEPFEKEEEKRALLQRCAYINLYPFCGKEKASSNYMDVLNALKTVGYDAPSVPIASTSSPEQIAQNRMSILREMAASGCKYAVTTPDIFEAVSRESETETGIVYYNRKGQKQRSFSCCKLFDGKLTVYSFWHPSYIGIRYEYLREINVLF